MAGVLKLYFRGLENPLFPKERFLDFISTISKSRTTQKPSRSLVSRLDGKERKHTLLFLRNSALLARRKACAAAYGINLTTRALCLIFNGRRGASSPQNNLPAVSTVIVWSLSGALVVWWKTGGSSNSFWNLFSFCFSSLWSMLLSRIWCILCFSWLMLKF